MGIRNFIRRWDAFVSDGYNALPLLLIGGSVAVVLGGLSLVGLVVWWLW